MNLLSASVETHQELVQKLQREGRLWDDRVQDAFAAVDRRHFVAPGTMSHLVYQDAALPIGEDQYIASPHMHAACLDLLGPQLQPGASVLDVGSGSGYLTAVMGLLVAPGGGRVLGVEKWADLAEHSINSIKKAQPKLLEDGSVRIVTGNALDGILKTDTTQYQAIHVGAAAAVLPDSLVKRLAPGGRMMIPVKAPDDFQTLRCVDKSPEGDVTQDDLMYVRYGLLVQPEDAKARI